MSLLGMNKISLETGLQFRARLEKSLAVAAWHLARTFHNLRATLRMGSRNILIAGLMGIVAGPMKAGEPQKPSDLFKVTNVWSVHFKFTPDQWAAMEPKRNGPGSFRGFGPAMFVAPVFLARGDQDRDGKLSKSEFSALAEKWFADWDKEKAGKLNANHLREGINSGFTPSDSGPPAGGRPGGPPGLVLQGPEGKRNGLASTMGTEFAYVRGDLEFEGQILKDVAVRYKGNGTWMQSQGSLKRSLKVDVNEFVKKQKVAGATKLNFHNSVTDASWMNEVLSHHLFRDAGVPAPRTAYARVYVSVPGKYEKQYFGLYSMVENLDENFAEEKFGTKKGAIFKPVTHSLFSYLGEDWAKYKQTYDPKTAVSNDEIRRVIEFSKLVTNAPDDEFAAKLGDYLDLDEFARFMAVTVWLSTIDSILAIGQNYYVYLHPKTHKFQFMPWDLDHSFGQFFMIGGQEQRENLSIHKPWQGSNRFLERVFKVEAFKKLYLAKMDEFSKSIFQPERFHKQVDEIAAAIRTAVQDESPTKLASFDKAVSGEPVQPAGFGDQLLGPPPGRGEGPDGPRPGGPGGFPFQSAKPIKGFVKARAQSVQDQLSGKSKGETLDQYGFGGGRGPGGPGGMGAGGPDNRGGRGGGPGGPGEMRPGMFLGGPFMTALDSSKDGEITRDEFVQGFAKWFDAWNTDKSGALSDDQLRKGIDQDLSPFRGGPPGGPQPRGQ
jgi:spore coat protein H